MPLFPFIETSGLIPLELPPSLTNLARPTNGVQTRPTPSPESIARFQAAMSEPPTVQRMAAPLAPPPPRRPRARRHPQGQSRLSPRPL